MNNSVLNKRALVRIALGGFFALTSLLLAMSLSWAVLASQNFMYSTWHDVGGIGEGIDKFGPKNRYKVGFGDTTKAQRAALFEQINIAVHRSGEGLAAIEYETPSSGGVTKLLRSPEVVHLQDVAMLIDKLKWTVVVNVVLFALVVFLVFRFREPMLKLSTMCTGVGVFFVFSLVIVFSIGPENVFNQLHIWVFPKENEWFFYYQDSLMSTLMLAPTLFGWIASALVVLAAIFWTGIVIGLVRIEKRIKR